MAMTQERIPHGASFAEEGEMPNSDCQRVSVNSIEASGQPSCASAGPPLVFKSIQGILPFCLSPLIVGTYQKKFIAFDALWPNENEKLVEVFVVFSFAFFCGGPRRVFAPRQRHLRC